jgi:hypothetical protein
MTGAADRARPPVRVVHLGLGAFHRAHQVWFTQRGDPSWGIAAFSGRSARLAETLSAQDCVYTLVERGPDADAFHRMSSLVVARGAERRQEFDRLVAHPDVAVVTLTITEAGYLLGPDGAVETGNRRDGTIPCGHQGLRVVVRRCGRQGRRVRPRADPRADRGPHRRHDRVVVSNAHIAPHFSDTGDSATRIVAADVLVTSPGRNFVTLRLRTRDGVTGLGDATVNGRELAVVSYLRDHVAPLLVGRDAHAIEDTWQYLYRGAYWRRGPITMAAIAAVDTALWDIKAKLAGLPLYQLLGGRSRRGCLAYGHASGSDVEELVRAA